MDGSPALIALVRWVNTEVVPPSAVAAVYGSGLNRASVGKYVVERNWFDVYSELSPARAALMPLK